jgi:hypothetical protein
MGEIGDRRWEIGERTCSAAPMREAGRLERPEPFPYLRSPISDLALLK